ncbi:MAG TPA: hypothetical protein VNC78_11405 [Actinomycetota bacterium]|nr:hypothetical protein [Actinomycetota bacterium]
MRRPVVLLLVLCLGVPLAAGAPSAGAEPGPGYFASEDVEWITIVPLETDSPGAALLDDTFYITTSRGLSIYDVSTPEAPVRLGGLTLLDTPQLSEEDVDTNGKILLLGTMGNLHIIDVEDKSNPTELAALPGADQHTMTCILECKYAYGSDGIIVDLRDPENPEIVGDWGEGMPASGGHDVTEVAPGRIVTSTNPIMLLDARKDPVHPKLLAVGAPGDERFMHSNLWPRSMKDKFLLVGGETSGPFCGEETSGSFMTWDATKWRKDKTFTMIDEYRVTDGLPTDGNAMVHTFCTHWFEQHPSFKNGGLVAMAWYEHGTRFFDISKKGQISEVGYFLPVGGATSAAYWITDEILYAVDYQRGIDILRFTGKK